MQVVKAAVFHRGCCSKRFQRITEFIGKIYCREDRGSPSILTKIRCAEDHFLTANEIISKPYTMRPTA